MIHNPLKTKNKWNMIFIAFLLVITTLLILPSQATAVIPSDGGAKAASSQDLILMLPSGRWAQQIGSITARTEPSSDLTGGFVTNMVSGIISSTRLALPNMMLMIMQACWSTALSLSQFAANFDPINTFGSKLDKAIGTLVDDIMAGGIPAVLIFLGIFGWIGAAAFNIGSRSEMVKRIGVTIVCLSMLIFTGAAAAKDGDSSTPTTGSPWWAVSTINSAVNTMAFGLNLDGLSDNDSNMMAASKPKDYKDKDSAAQTTLNCQVYLYQMHKAYDAAAKKSTSGVNTSSVTKAVNRMWEETVLRSWVTMQYGNPAADGTTTTPQVASNAQQAYCHVLEAYAHTDTDTQMELTNATLGTSINPKTATYLFNPDRGFIDPWEGVVNPDKAFERDLDIHAQRAAIFWETCTADNSGKGMARKGWARLIRNLGDRQKTGTIKGGGGKDLRSERGGKLANVINIDESPIMSDDITADCRAVFENKMYQGSDDQDPSKNGGNFIGLATGDAAGMGWRFDVPNVSDTWRQANIFSGAGDGSDSTATMADLQGVKTTVDYLYGNNKTDVQGALGSMIGAVVNMIVWSLLSLFLIVSKLMLTFCILAMIVAFLVAAFPFGDAPRKVLIKWAKGCVNFSMVGILYSVLGSIATCICQITISATGMVSSSFFYNLLTGISPALALIVIALTCGMLGLKNPFSIKAIATMAGGGALYAGITRYGRKAAFDTIRNARGNKGSDKKDEEGRESSKSNGTGNARESAEVLRKGTSKNGQVKEGEEKDTKAKDEDEKSEVDKAEGGTIVASENDATSNEKDDDKDSDQDEAEDEKTLFGGQKWADRDPNTVRGSLGDYVEKTKSAWGEHHDNLNGALAKHAEDEKKDVLKRISEGVDPETAQYRASRRRNLLDAKSKAAYGAGMVFRTASTAMAAGVAVAKSQPIRDGLKKVTPIAKTAAKAAVTVAAFSNPVTAGVGVLMAAKMLTNRDNLSNGVHAVAGVGHAAKGISVGLPKKLNELTNSTVGRNLGSTKGGVFQTFEQMGERKPTPVKGGVSPKPGSAQPMPIATKGNVSTAQRKELPSSSTGNNTQLPNVNLAQQVGAQTGLPSTTQAVNVPNVRATRSTGGTLAEKKSVPLRQPTVPPQTRPQTAGGEKPQLKIGGVKGVTFGS